MHNFIDSTVPDDGLAPLVVGPSAGTVMIKFRSCIFMGLALIGLTHCGLVM